MAKLMTQQLADQDARRRSDRSGASGGRYNKVGSGKQWNKFERPPERWMIVYANRQIANSATFCRLIRGIWQSVDRMILPARLARCWSAEIDASEFKISSQKFSQTFQWSFHWIECKLFGVSLQSKTVVNGWETDQRKLEQTQTFGRSEAISPESHRNHSEENKTKKQSV